MSMIDLAINTPLPVSAGEQIKPYKHIIDPEGDIILVTGDYQLLVSSNRLKEAAAFWRACLRHDFKEKRDLEQSKSPMEILLLEDDGDALWIFVSNLYHEEAVSDLLTPMPELLEAVVTIADKYFSIHNIKHLFTHWMTGYDLDSLVIEELEMLAHSSRIVGNARQFWRVTQKIIRNATALDVAKIKSACLRSAYPHFSASLDLTSRQKWYRLNSFVHSSDSRASSRMALKHFESKRPRFMGSGAIAAV